MNREQKRDFIRKASKNGMGKKAAKVFADSIGSVHSEPQDIQDGDKVIINVDLVKGRKNYESMSTKYKDFVESVGDTVFTARQERKNLISLEESPQWLFWSGDLIIVNEEDSKVTTE